jgi:hypothetical protein
MLYLETVTVTGTMMTLRESIDIVKIRHRNQNLTTI